MSEAHEQGENDAGVAGAWMLFVIMIGGSLLSAVVMFLMVAMFGITARDVVPDFPSPTPDYPSVTPSFPGSSTGGDYDFIEPDTDSILPNTGIFGGEKIDSETCAQLEKMSNEEAYKLYQQYCL